MIWPALKQAVDALRHDDHHPLHALDGSMLSAIEKSPPSTVSDLARSCLLRMGPKGSGPELTPEQVLRWIREATERQLIEARTVDSAGPPEWSLTDRGRERLKTLHDLKARLGGGLAAVTRVPSVWAYAVERLAEEDEIREGEAPPKREGLPKIRKNPGDDPSLTDVQALENLERVEHIVVLMMENRSFDHMMGYLDLIDDQHEVRGLTNAKPITYEGQAHSPRYLLGTALPKSMDPPHGSKEIAKQINGGAMDGFIESFAHTNQVDDPWRIMDYYTHRELPVYDYFAHNFLMCDQWFSSVPSSTWQNRLYAVAGTCDPEHEGIRSFDLRSFVQLLDQNESPDTWRWYSWDPGTLRLVDRHYLANVGERFHHDHFRRVVQHSVEPLDLRRADGEAKLALGKGFLEDAANGDLAKVSWIDPNFVDLSILESNSNDDHPPSDVRAGQELVMMVFRALAESPRWEETLLLVTYDEHGGFYDHDPPGPPPEEQPQFSTYGLRVPAFLVSPFVEPCTVSHSTFDHTSIIRTILERFGTEGAVHEMAKTAPRVEKADHLGRLLTREPSGDVGAPDYAQVNAMLDAWRHRRAERRSAASPELARRRTENDPWEPRPITGFPAEYLDAARELRKQGLPAGHP